jgi:ribosomal-protein-serine acetyltransferase
VTRAGDAFAVSESRSPSGATVGEVLDAGGGLVLRRPAPEHAERLAEAITASREHLRPHMGWIAHEPLPIEERLELIGRWRHDWENGGDMVLFMFVGETLVGSCGLHRRLGPHGLEIGYWVHADHVRKGYATRASAALTTAAFTLPEIDFVEIHHDVNNTRSGRVPARLGYADKGVVAGKVHAPGDDGRDRIWRVTREEWGRADRG